MPWRRGPRESKSPGSLRTGISSKIERSLSVRIRLGTRFTHHCAAAEFALSKQLASGRGQQLLLLGQERRLVCRRKKGMRAFHVSVLDQHDEIIGGDRRMAKLRLF